jgi:hypothetical protein
VALGSFWPRSIAEIWLWATPMVSANSTWLVSKPRSSRILRATQEGATLEPPHLIQWEDGTPATHDDYRKYLDDTHTWAVKSPSMVERRIFPDIVADVRYDALAGVWAISGQGIDPVLLTLKNPNATDAQILEELYTLPTIYRARIHR